MNRRRLASANSSLLALLALLALGLLVGGAGACRRASPTAAGAGGGASPLARGHEASPAPASLDFTLVGEGEGPLVVLLHGYGTAGDDLRGLADALRRDRRLGHLRFALPVGRLGLTYGGRAWWPLPSRIFREQAVRAGTRNTADEHPPELPSSREAVLALVDTLATRHSLSPGEIAFGGFSQGAMLAVDVALHRRDAPGAVFALSGSAVAESDWRPRLPLLRGVPVMVSHGRQDSVLPFSGGQHLFELLSRAGADVSFVPFEGDHTISPEVLSALGDFLAEAFPPP